MGLQVVEKPGDAPDAGMFRLPPDFPKNLASQWVEESQVPYLRQRQTLIGTGYSADGWTVYKAEPSAKQTMVVDGKGKKFVLMVRDRDLQNQVNAVYGNVSKQRINREVSGETVTGSAKQDSGILTEEALRANQVGGTSEESSLELNDVVKTPVPST